MLSQVPTPSHCSFFPHLQNSVSLSSLPREGWSLALVRPFTGSKGSGPPVLNNVLFCMRDLSPHSKPECEPTRYTEKLESAQMADVPCHVTWRLSSSFRQRCNPRWERCPNRGMVWTPGRVRPHARPARSRSWGRMRPFLRAFSRRRSALAAFFLRRFWRRWSCRRCILSTT